MRNSRDPSIQLCHKGFKCNVLRMKRGGRGGACLIGTGLALLESTRYRKKATLKVKFRRLT